MLDTTTPAEPVVVSRTDLRPCALLAAIAVGVVADLGVRGDPANLLLAVALGGLVALLLVSRTAARTSARLLLLAALVPVAMLAVRASPWLTASNLTLTIALVASAVLFGRQGSIFDATPATWLRRLGPAGAALAGIGDDAVAEVRRVGGHHAPLVTRILRAIVFALPFLALVLVLLANADAVFAEIVTPDFDAGAGLGHLAVIAIAMSVVVAVRGTAHRIEAHDSVRSGRFGALEVAIMLGLLGGVLTAFVTVQLIALTGAGERLVRETGLTPAQYARSGFFELCWAVLVIAVLLAMIRRACEPTVFRRPSLRFLHAAVPVLTIGLVIVSLRRMAYYDDAFGLTMLRVWAVGAIVCIGAMLLVLAIRNAVFPRADVVGGIALMIAFVLVVGADVANPEAFVVAHNAARSRAGATIDLEYLGTLSDDAVPQIAETFRTRPWLVRELVDCQQSTQGVGRLNLAAHRAAAVRNRVCGARSGVRGP